MEPVTIELPIYLQMGVKKKSTFALNLNEYRNAHYQILNNAKILFNELVSKRIAHLPRMVKVDLTYRLFFGSNRSVDVSNVCSIVDKFFSDTLVHSQKIPDDNRDFIENVRYAWGGVDKTNPRIEVTLSNIELEAQEEKPMRIILIQSEIEQALKKHVLSQISLREDQTVSIEFKATRGEEGYTAEITVSQTEEAPFEVTPLAETPKPKPQASAQPPAAAAASPKPTTKPVEKPAEKPAQAAPKAETKADTPKPTPAAQQATQAAVANVVKQEPKTLFAAPKASPAPTPAPAAGGGKSLFSNLTKPVNPKPAQPVANGAG